MADPVSNSSNKSTSQQIVELVQSKVKPMEEGKVKADPRVLATAVSMLAEIVEAQEVRQQALDLRLLTLERGPR